MHILDIEVIGEKNILVEAMQPVRTLRLSTVPEFTKARLGDDRIARAEGDELSGGQLCMACEWFENVADIVVGDLQTLRHRAAIKMRAALVIDCDFHK